MEIEVILKVIFIAIVHWALVGIALRNLVERQRVLGSRKGLWALPIFFVTCFGSLTYLIIHELYPEPQTQVDYNR